MREREDDARRARLEELHVELVELQMVQRLAQALRLVRRRHRLDARVCDRIEQLVILVAVVAAAVVVVVVEFVHLFLRAIRAMSHEVGMDVDGAARRVDRVLARLDDAEYDVEAMLEHASLVYEKYDGDEVANAGRDVEAQVVEYDGPVESVRLVVDGEGDRADVRSAHGRLVERLIRVHHDQLEQVLVELDRRRRRANVVVRLLLLLLMRL